jgi:phage terminase large subunit GpA-like protein
MSLDEEYFKQLTAEKRKAKFIRGHKKYEWIATRKRNEALDLMVYNIAALNIIAFVVFPNLTISSMLDSLSEDIKEESYSPVKNAKAKGRVLNPGERIE